MSFRQVRYCLVNGSLVRNVFDSDEPMDGWALDEGSAEELTEEKPKKRTKKVASDDNSTDSN